LGGEMSDKNALEGFNPEVVLDRAEQSHLASVVSQPGFAVIQKIGKSIVDQFVRVAINQKEDEDVLKAHRNAKIAAQIYTMLIEHIKTEVMMYIQIKDSEEPTVVESGDNLELQDFNEEEEPPIYE